jgi:hypothetical protein
VGERRRVVGRRRPRAISGAAPAMSATPYPPWTLNVSSKTGIEYYFNPHSKRSLWRDPALPAGWAWERAGASAPKTFEHLATGERRPSPPPLGAAPAAAADAAAAVAAPAAASPNPPKRARTEAPAPAAASAPAAALPGAAVPGRALPSLPGFTDTNGQPLPSLCLGFCEEAPACLAGCPRPAGGVFFGDAHTFLLRQLVRAAVARHGAQQAALQQRAVAAGRRDATEGAERMVLLDVGAGGGASTAFLLDAAAGAAGGAQVYALDLWDLGADYYAEQLRYFGHDAAAAAWAAGDLSGGGGGGGGKAPPAAAPPPAAASAAASAAAAPPAAAPRFQQFCARFWDSQEGGVVVPATFPAEYGLRYLHHHLDLQPALIYVDADLSKRGLRAALDVIWAQWLDPDAPAVPGRAARGPAPLLAGGGWAASEGVRAAVGEFVGAHGGLALHVEGGHVWTLAVGAVVETRNEGVAADGGGGGRAVDAGAVDAVRVTGEAAERAGALQAWQAAVFGAIEARGEDAAALHAAIESAPPAKRAGEAGGAAAAAAPEAGPWLDRGGNDKRHLTPLMRAAKLGKTALVVALIDQHGAGVNVQAPRSAFTALHLAAFEGHAAAAEALLARGADTALVNKWGESVRKIAADKRLANILALLDRAEARRGGAR